MLFTLLACTSLSASPLDHHATEARSIRPYDCTVPVDALPPTQVTLSDDGRYRFIRGNGVPDHDVGPFPNAGNPHTISEQRVDYRVPVRPSGSGAALEGRAFGVTLQGVKLDPGTAEAWRDDRSSGWNYEALGGAMDLGVDCNHAHVQPSGAYHYHGVPTKLREHEPIGWAADGHPIVIDRAATTSYRLREGLRPGGSEPGGVFDGTFTQDFEFVEGMGSLDACNGRLTDEGYEYVLTDAFPFVPRCWVNSPDPSFDRKGPPPGRHHRPPPPR